MQLLQTANGNKLLSCRSKERTIIFLPGDSVAILSLQETFFSQNCSAGTRSFLLLACASNLLFENFSLKVLNF